MKLLLINYAPRPLVKALEEAGHEVDAVEGSASPEGWRGYEAVYFAKFTPPVFDDLALLFRARAPVIYGFHSPFRIFHPHRPSHYVHNAVSALKVMAARLRRSIALFHALNKKEEEALRKYTPRVYHAPLGIDVEEFKPGEKTGPFTVVFVGARYQKGADMLPEVIPRVLKRAPDARFVLTGRRDFLSPLFRELGRRYPQVAVQEDLPRRAFVELFSEAHVLLVLSRYEGFARVVPEALAAGMGVVAFDVPGPSDVLKEHGVGLVSRPFDLESVAGSVLLYYEAWRRGSFDDVAKGSRRAALSYDWRKVARAWERMFELCASRS